VPLTFDKFGLPLASTPAYFKMVRNFTATAAAL
jgi:hypothetical protein